MGTTSYIIPDDILPNVRYLADKVDDVQLILFESDVISNLPSPEVIRELADIGRATDLTYTIHFPLDVFLGSGDESVRRISVDKCRRIIDLCSVLNPQTYALHLAADDPDDRGRIPSDNMERWCSALHRSIEALTQNVASSRQLCIETLAYPFALVDGIVETHDTGVCLDIGHLLRWGYDVPAHFERYSDRTHLIHMHGVRDDGDHCSLCHLDEVLIDAAMQMMVPSDAESRVMIIEVFNESDFNASMQLMEQRLKLQ